MLPLISMGAVGDLCSPCAGAGGSSAAPASLGFFTRGRRGLASGSSPGSCLFFFSFCPHGWCCRGGASLKHLFPLPGNPCSYSTGFLSETQPSFSLAQHGSKGHAPEQGHTPTFQRVTYHGAAPRGRQREENRKDC